MRLQFFCGHSVREVCWKTTATKTQASELLFARRTEVHPRFYNEDLHARAMGKTAAKTRNLKNNKFRTSSA